jgi:hypothetical protein
MNAQARSSDPATSHEAAASLDEQALTMRRRAILYVLRTFGPHSDEGIALAYDYATEHGAMLPAQSPSGLRTRRRELVDLGLVVDTGEKALTASGRHTIVWAAS